MSEDRKVNEIKWRKDLYPRTNPDPIIIQKYAEDLEVLPPIEINQHNEIIDGYHRWIAHKKKKAKTISVIITQTASDIELLRFAITRNSTHGLQLNNDDKHSMARKLYMDKSIDKEEIAKILSVTSRSINSWVQDIDKARKDERDKKIQDMWFACYTLEEIASEIGVVKATISKEKEDCSVLEKFPKLNKLSALYQDKFEPELYDIWNFAKKTNEVKIHGNTEVRIVDNLLYKFTRPFDIVIDPFAGGGSTIDVCKKRLRRYWASDRIPVVERMDIREHDLTNGITGPYHWEDVALVYLDPPYWKQSAGKYSDDPTDLANMPLDEFTRTLITIIEDYGDKIKAGSHIVCIISPTQWPNEDKSVNYHDIDLTCYNYRNLKLINRIICPYSTQQYNGTQVDIAKKEKIWMVLSRTMLIWERI